MISIYVTFPGKKSARKVIEKLLSKGLIACANVYKAESHYIWKNRVEQQKECIAFLKTNKKHWKKIKKSILKNHPYETPCILKFKVDAEANFQEWLNYNIS